MSAIKALYAMGEKYGVPKSEIDKWVGEHVTKLYFNYSISGYVRKNFPSEIESIESDYRSNGLNQIARQLPYTVKIDEFSNYNITTMKVLALK